MYAAAVSNLETFKLYEKYGVNFDLLNNNGNSILQFAISSKNNSIAEFIMDNMKPNNSSEIVKISMNNNKKVDNLR